MPLTRQDIEDILGPVDEYLATQLVAVGGTAAELAEAQAWYNGNDALLDQGRQLPQGRVSAFVSVLEGADYITPEEI